jgi:hypothetical protein
MLLAVVAGLGGFGAEVVSSPQYIVQPLTLDKVQPCARLYDGAVAPERFVGEIEVSELLAPLRGAAWTNDRLMRKGAWILEFGDMTRVCISYYGGFFWVSGRQGYFVVTESQRPAFQHWVEERISKPTIEWRIRRNTAGKSFPNTVSEKSGCSIV